MELVQGVFRGIAVGCIYGLVALGFVLIYKATEVVNFAQGDVMMLGGFVAYTFFSIWHLPFGFAVLATVAVLAVFGALFERFVLRHILGQPAFAAVMVTVGRASSSSTASSVSG